MYTTTGEQYCVDVEQVRKEKEKIKMMENTYNDCNNASEPKQSVTIKEETITSIEVETRAVLEAVNDILNFCLRSICFGDAEEEAKMKPECLMELQRYNRELARKIEDKALTIKSILVAD